MSLECFVLNCNLQFEYGILWWPGPITNWKRSIDFEKVPRHFEETLSLSLSLPICLVVKENSAGRSCTSPKEKQHPLVSLKRRRFVTNASRALSHASSLIYYVQTDGHMFLRAASISRCLRTSFIFVFYCPPLYFKMKVMCMETSCFLPNLFSIRSVIDVFWLAFRQDTMDIWYVTVCRIVSCVVPSKVRFDRYNGQYRMTCESQDVVVFLAFFSTIWKILDSPTNILFHHSFPSQSRKRLKPDPCVTVIFFFTFKSGWGGWIRSLSDKLEVSDRITMKKNCSGLLAGHMFSKTCITSLQNRQLVRTCGRRERKKDRLHTHTHYRTCVYWKKRGGSGFRTNIWVKYTRV